MKKHLPLLFVLGFVVATAMPAVAGTCYGGPRNGQSCFSNSDCGKTCSGGPRNGQTCSFYTDCGKACYGGSRNGQSCSSNSDCPGGGTCIGFTCTGYTCVGSPSEACSQSFFFPIDPTQSPEKGNVDGGHSKPDRGDRPPF
jgi:hypothetical protein